VRLFKTGLLGRTDRVPQTFGEAKTWQKEALSYQITKNLQWVENLKVH